MARVAVLMSGGVDSSCAALLLVRAGHEVAGLTAVMWREASRCCGEDDVYRAQRVCHRLGIPHLVVDLARDFERHVIRGFVDSYLDGSTPNPCAVCNREIKFGVMLERALRLGFDRIASGHYANLRPVGHHVVLAEPEDRRKSQVYFLALVRQDALMKVDFPLAGLSKRDVVEMVRGAGLAVRNGESQDLCFAAPGRHADVLRSRAPEWGPGNILDLEGAVVGQHRGHFAYTVGQRLGAGGKRLYVVRKDARANEVTVAERSRVTARRLRAGPVNPFLGIETAEGDVVLVKCRHNSRAAKGRILAKSAEAVEVVLDEPYFAAAPGQILVCYNDESVACAGVIREALP